MDYIIPGSIWSEAHTIAEIQWILFHYTYIKIKVVPDKIQIEIGIIKAIIWKSLSLMIEIKLKIFRRAKLTEWLSWTEKIRKPKITKCVIFLK